MFRSHVCCLAITLAVAVAAACGGDKSSATPEEADGPAGEVIELTGKVTAESAGAERILKVGDKVMANETIVTAKDASIAIRLFHNEARWELSGDKRRAVRKSLAWNAPKGKTSGGKAVDVTMAAGRHAERQAGSTTPVRSAAVAAPKDDSVADVVPDKPAAPNLAPAKPVAKQAEQPAPRVVRQPLRRKMKRPRAKRRTMRKLKPSRDSSLGNVLGGGVKSGGTGIGGIGTTGRGGGGTGGGIGINSPIAKKSAKGKARARVSFGPILVTGPLPRAAARSRLRRLGRLFRACYEKALAVDKTLSGIIKVKVLVTKQGRTRRVIVVGNKLLKKALGLCVASRLRRLKFPVHAGDSLIVQSLRFRR